MAQSVNDYHSISRLLYTQRVKYDVPDHVLLGTAVLCVLFSNYSIIFNLLSDRVVQRSRVVALYGQLRCHHLQWTENESAEKPNSKHDAYFDKEQSVCIVFIDA